MTFYLAILLLLPLGEAGTPAEQAALIETVLASGTEKNAVDAAMQKLDLAGLIEVVTRADGNSHAHKSAARAIRALLPTLNDAGMLGKVALLRGTLATYDLRRKAIPKVTDQAILAKVAMTDEEREHREMALERVSDAGLLEEVAGSGLYADARVAALARLPKLDATLANTILIFAVEKDAWSQLPNLAKLKFTLSSEAKKSLEQLARQDPAFGPNAARALLSGLKVSSWPELRLESSLDVRPEKDAYFFGGRVPPGKYSLKVDFKDYNITSTRHETVTGDLRAGRCYVIRSGRTFADAMGKGSWSPRIEQERCTQAK